MGQGADSLYVRKPFILAAVGTSLSYPNAFGGGWWQRLYQAAQGLPEAVGPVVVRNFAQGGAQSTYGVTIAPEVAAINPTHILSEGFAINDAAPAIAVVSRAQHLDNMAAMRAVWKAKNPAVDITWQTMNPVSAEGQPSRPDLALYYGDEITFANTNGDTLLDHYNGLPSPPAVAGGWPKPLPSFMTLNDDGLHPVWADSLEFYFWPGLIYWLRCKMAGHWGLPIPNPPEPPPLPDANYLIAAGGGGGGSYVGAGAGAGGRRRGVTSLSNLFGRVLVGRGGLKGPTSVSASPESRGFKGENSVLGVGDAAITAEGGGFGAGYASGGGAPGNGGSGGSGGGSYGTGAIPGEGRPGQGYGGGLGLAPNNMSGGGGGALGAGKSGAEGGAGGPGVLADFPGAPAGLYICGGGPGVSYPTAPQPYPNGGGPTNYGGGGRGGDDAWNPIHGAHDGGPGGVWVWYPGAARAAGGTVTTFGGFTVHQFTRTDFGPPAAMTANNAPAGYVAAASSEFSATYPPFKAFNGMIATDADRWASGADAASPAFLRLSLPAPKAFSAYRMVDTGATSTTPGAQQPKSWILYGTNNLGDFGTWVICDQRTDIPARPALTDTVYEMSGPGAGVAFQHFQMVISAPVGNDRNIVSIAELEFIPGLKALP